MKLVDWAKAKVAEARERWPLVDHAVRAHEHFSAVNGGQQAAGVTYFGFLSIFPILALAFFAVGLISSVLPDARDNLLDMINGLLPGLIGDGDGDLSLTDIEGSANAVGLIGLAGVIYAGLGWVSSLRSALMEVFERPAEEAPSFVRGKLRDLATMCVVGGTLFLSVGLSGVVTRLSGGVLDLVGLERSFGWVLTLLALALGILIGAQLFYLIFRMLAAPPIPRLALWRGAIVGAIGFELLKQMSGYLLSSTKEEPAFQAFGIALILLVWINYFSQVILYSASWAHTSDLAQEARAEAEAGETVDMALGQ